MRSILRAIRASPVRRNASLRLRLAWHELLGLPVAARALLFRFDPAASERRSMRTLGRHAFEVDRGAPLPDLPLDALLSPGAVGQTTVAASVTCRASSSPDSVHSSLAGERALWRDHEFVTAELRIERIRNHYWFPHSRLLVSENGKLWRHSTVSTSSNMESIKSFALVRDRNSGGLVFDERRVASAPVVAESRMIVSHHLMDNYGHFLLDLAPLIDFAATNALPCISKPLRPWQKAIHARLGLPVERVKLCGQRVVFLKDALVSDRLTAEGSLSPQLREVFERVRGRIPAEAIRAKRFDRILVLRAESEKRCMRNRQQLAEALSSLGFEVVRPETLPFDDQVAIFSNARCVVGEFGAGLANSVFCRTGTKVVEILPEGLFNRWFVDLCAVLGLEHYAMFQPLDADERRFTSSEGSRFVNGRFAYTVDVAAIVALAKRL